MNGEDIIRMAREVGFVAYGEDEGEYRIPTPAFHGRLERFAALVAAAEREACAKVCDAAIPYLRVVPGEEMYYSGVHLCTNLAAEIRARGQA